MTDREPPLTHLSVTLVVGGGACAAAGWLAFEVPWRLALLAGTTRAPNAVDGMHPISLVLLGLVGFAAGTIAPRAWWLWGPASVAAFPCIAIFEMFLDPSSHNLWPFEFVLYAALAIPGTAGAGLGALLRWWISRRSAARPPE